MLTFYLNTFTRNAFLATLILFPALVFGQQLPQSGFNFGFEKISDSTAMPDYWISRGPGYVIQLDSLERHEGNNSVRITGYESHADQPFGFIRWTIPARYDAKKIELRGYMNI